MAEKRNISRCLVLSWSHSVYYETDLQSRVPPCHIPATRWGQHQPGQPNLGAKNRRSTERGGMDACGRPRTAGNFKPTALTATPC